LAVAALIVSAVGLLLAALSFGWQIASWVFDGRRVRVRLLHGAVGPAGSATGKVGKDRRPKDMKSLVAEGFDRQEVIGIAVTNVGRAPVRIDRYGVHLAEGGFSFYPIGDAIGPILPFRLAPGETETWLADANDARRLITTTRAIGKKASNDVFMQVELGTGDHRRTRQTIVLPLR